MKTLYPLVGAYAGILSLGFGAYHLRDIRKEREGGGQEKKVVETTLSKSNIILMVALFSALFFLYVGMEVAFGTFVPVFAVQSSLKFTRKQVKLMITLTLHYSVSVSVSVSAIVSVSVSVVTILTLALALTLTLTLALALTLTLTLTLTLKLTLSLNRTLPPPGFRRGCCLLGKLCDNSGPGNLCCYCCLA